MAREVKNNASGVPFSALPVSRLSQIPKKEFLLTQQENLLVPDNLTPLF